MTDPVARSDEKMYQMFTRGKQTGHDDLRNALLDLLGVADLIAKAIDEHEQRKHP